MSDQQELAVEGPGVSKPEGIKELDNALRDYLAVRDPRMELSRKESPLKQTVADLLHAHEDTIGKDGDGVIRYKYNGKIVKLRPSKEKLSITADESEEEEIDVEGE